MEVIQVIHEYSPARFGIRFFSFIGKRSVFLSVLFSAILLSPFASFAQVKLEVFGPPSSPPSWLVNSHLVSGATFFVKWSTVEPVAGSYDFSSTDRRFAPWIAAGVKVNIIFEAVALSAPNSVTPSWLMLELGLDQTASCDSDVIPNYFSSVFQARYQRVMAAVVDHYRGNPSVGYVRFGLGRGGETHPAPTAAFNDTSGSCYQKFVSLGWTKTSWVNYIGKMLAYEKTLGATFPLLVTASNELGDVSISDAIANVAAPLGFGLGYQGYSTNDISKYNSGQRCPNDWCGLWNTYAGQVEMENQLGRSGSISDPTGGGNGSLVQLLPFARDRHVTIFEQNFQDWRTAFDPTSSLYPTYHVAYAAAMQAASQ
jgi:hypothetical protein